MSQRVLIVDDDLELCELLSDFLGLEGFTVDTIHDGKDAVERCKATTPDAVVLDVMLPRLQGFDVLRKLREFSDVPVLMLTARGDETDRIVGLEMGADDYLPKPCNPRELAARLRAILRRSERAPGRQSATILEVGDTSLNTGDRRARHGGADLELTTAEFNILAVLLRQAGQVADKDFLCRQALGRALTPYDRSVDVHVSNVRKKLAAHGGSQLIKNIRGVGYQFLVGEEDD